MTICGFKFNGIIVGVGFGVGLGAGSGVDVWVTVAAVGAGGSGAGVTCAQAERISKLTMKIIGESFICIEIFNANERCVLESVHRPIRDKTFSNADKRPAILNH